MPDLVIPLSGGLNLQDDPTQCPPGSLRDCLNFEVTQQDGYSCRQGWAPYDGTVIAQELTVFLFVEFGAGNVTGTPVYGENVALTVTGGVVINVICLGMTGGNSDVAFVYNNTTAGSYVNWKGLNVTAAVGSVSGFTVNPLTYPVLNTQVYLPTTLSSSGYIALLAGMSTNQAAAVNAVPGNALSPPDSTFFLSDAAYCTHDCIVFFFNSGTNASLVRLLEGHVIKSVGGAATYGTILSVVVQSGDWPSGTAAGYVVVYDVPLTTTFPANATQMAAYSADGVTPRGSIFKYTSVGSLTGKPANTRSLIYKANEQSVGYTSAYAGWARVPLSREMSYAQAYPGQTTGIGFGPTGGAPYSIYEYDRSQLTSILTQLTPITSQFWGCTAPTQGGGSSWTNLTNIEVNDGTFATSSHPHSATGSNPGHYFQAQTFAFTDVPAGSAVLGITVEINAKTTTSAATIKDSEIYLIKPDGTYAGQGTGGGGNHGSNTFLTTALTFDNYGGANDLWGYGWKLTDLTSAAFGVFVRYTNVSTTTDDTVSVDFVGVQVTYIPPSRIVYIRNALATSPTDVPAFIVHYTLDNNTQFSSNNGVGTLTLYSTGTEASFTAAGKSRVIGAGEQIRDAPAGAGNLLGWTTSTDSPTSLPCGASLDSNGSRWDWITYNFYSDPSAQMAFGANGVEYGIGFDGTYLIRIRTGRTAALDNPRHLFAYASNLHLGYNSGDTIVTAPGRPLTVSGLQLSQLYNIGQPVMGYANLAGQVLAVFGSRSVFGLQGTDPTNYTQITLSPALGAFEYTVVNVEGEVLWTSFRGVETLSTTNAYGEFDTVPLSQASTPWLQPRLQGDNRIAILNQRPVYALAVRNKRQYRLFFADGYTFSLTKFGPNGIPMGMIGSYGGLTGDAVVARHVFQGIRSDGKEVLFACWDSLISIALGTPSYYPYVARIDVGYLDNNTFNTTYLEINPVYPYQQNKDLTPTTQCQYQWARMFASSMATGSANAFVDFYTMAGDDLPVSFGNYINYPTTAAPSKMQMAPTLTQLFLPVPVVPSDCTIAAYGRMIRTLIYLPDSMGQFRATKMQITYEVQMQERT